MPNWVIVVAIAAALIGIMGGDGVVDRRVDEIEARVDTLEVRADLAGLPEPGALIEFDIPDTLSGAERDVDTPMLWGPEAVAVPPAQKGGE